MTALEPYTNHQKPAWVELLPRAAELAKMIANTEFVPKTLRDKPAAITAAILYGQEVGLGPMTSLSQIAVVDGRPTLSAEGQRGLILAAGHEIWLEEATVTRATLGGRRKDSEQVTRVTWTIDDAKRANLAGKANWRTYPRAMLQARATAELARLIFADVIAGLAATEEVLEGPAELEPVPATAKRRRSAVAPIAPAPEPEQTDEVEQAEPAPMATDPQRRKMFALLKERGITERYERLDFIAAILGHRIASSSELTSEEISGIIDALDNYQQQPEKPGLPDDEQVVIDAIVEEFEAEEKTDTYNTFPEGY